VTHRDAVQHVTVLRRITNTGLNIQTWLALIEDELQTAIPDSQLLARFRQIRADAEKAASAMATTPTSQAEAKIRSDCEDLIEAVCARLESAPASRDELTEEVDRIIQNGYFKSPYFRAVLGGLALVLLLVTGVEGYRLNEQVKAMQQLVADARKQVEDGRIEVAKSTAETRDRQAQLALALVQGSEEMVKLRTSAMQQITLDQEASRLKIQQDTGTWAAEVAKAGSEATRKVTGKGESAVGELSARTDKSDKQIDQALEQSKSAIASKLASTVTALGATQHPWVPRAIWSMSSSWILLPITLVIAVFAFLNSFVRLAKEKKGFAVGLGTAASVLLVANLVLFWWLR
jgi:hypothetical protein